MKWKRNINGKGRREKSEGNRKRIKKYRRNEKKEVIFEEEEIRDENK